MTFLYCSARQKRMNSKWDIDLIISMYLKTTYIDAFCFYEANTKFNFCNFFGFQMVLYILL